MNTFAKVFLLAVVSGSFLPSWVECYSAQLYYDGYTAREFAFTSFTATRNPYFSFKNPQAANSTLNSFSFEFWARLNDSSQYQLASRYFYESSSIASAFVNSTAITFTVLGNQLVLNISQINTSSIPMVHSFDQFMTSWHHYSFGYDNSSQQLLIHTDGVYQKSMQGNGSGSPLAYTSLASSTYYVGNSKQIVAANALNGDMRYIALYAQAWNTTSFSPKHHLEPNPFVKLLLYYFGMTDLAFRNPFTGSSSTILAQSALGLATISSEQQAEFVCTCRGEPFDFIQFDSASNAANQGLLQPMGVPLQGKDLSQGATFDIWFKASSVDGSGDIFSISGLAKLGASRQQYLSLTIGNDTQTSYIFNTAQIYLNNWIYAVITITKANVTLILQDSITQTLVLQPQATLTSSSSVLFTQLQGFKGAIYSVRLWSTVHMSRPLMTTLYRSTTNPILSSEFLDNLVFEVIYVTNQLQTDSQKTLRAYPLQAGDQQSSFYLLNRMNKSQNNFESLLATYGSNLTFSLSQGRQSILHNRDFGPCIRGWDGASCRDDKSYPFFESSVTQKQVLTQYLQSRFRFMTVELWFKGYQPPGYSTSVIYMDYNIIGTTGLQISLDYSSSAFVCDLGDSISQLAGAGQQVKLQGLQQGEWFHLACITSLTSKTTQLMAYQLSSATESVSTATNTYTLDLTEAYFSTFLANNQGSSAPFVGYIREVRQWFTSRSLDTIRQYRFQTIPIDRRSNLINYFPQNIPYDNTVFLNYIPMEDITRNNTLTVTNYQSQSEGLFRWKYDAELTLCPQYAHYVNGICRAINPQIAIIIYQENSYYTFDSQLSFSDPMENTLYSYSWSLVSITPTNDVYSSSIGSLFSSPVNQKAIHIPVSQFKSTFTYNVMFSISSILTSQYQVSAQATLYPNCPSLAFANASSDGLSPIFTNNPSPSTVVVVPNIQCLQSDPGLSFVNLTWSATPDLGNYTQYFTVKASASNQFQIIITKIYNPIPTGISFSISSFLQYKSVLTNQIHQIGSALTIYTTDKSVAIVVAPFVQRLYQSQALTIDASQSNIIDPDYFGRNVMYGLNCPPGLFSDSAVCQVYSNGKFYISQQQMSAFTSVQGAYYTFSIRAYPQFASSQVSVKSFQLTWVKWSNNMVNCPSVQMPSTINLTNTVGSLTIQPTIYQDCGYDINSITKSYDIQQIVWTLNGNTSVAITAANNGLLIYLRQSYIFGSQANQLQVAVSLVNIANSSDTLVVSATTILNQSQQSVKILLKQSQEELIFALEQNITLNASLSYFSDTALIPFADSLSSLPYNPYDLTYLWGCPPQISDCTTLSNGKVLNILPKSRLEIALPLLFGYHYPFSLTVTHAPTKVMITQIFEVVLTLPSQAIYSINSCAQIQLDAATLSQFQGYNGAYEYNVDFQRSRDLTINMPALAGALVSCANKNLQQLGFYIQIAYPLNTARNLLNVLKGQYIIDSASLNRLSAPMTVQILFFAKDTTNGLYYYSNVDILITPVSTLGIFLAAQLYFVQQLETLSAPTFLPPTLLAEQSLMMYNWTCDIPAICPASSSSDLVLTPALRINNRVNDPSAEYEFKVQATLNNATAQQSTNQISMLVHISPSFDNYYLDYCYITSFAGVLQNSLIIDQRIKDNIPLEIQYFDICSSTAQQSTTLTGITQQIASDVSGIDYFDCALFMGNQFVGLSPNYNFNLPSRPLTAVLQTSVSYSVPQFDHTATVYEQLIIANQIPSIYSVISTNSTITLDTNSIILSSSVYNTIGLLPPNVTCQWNCPVYFGGLDCSSSCTNVALTIITEQNSNLSATQLASITQPQLFQLLVYYDSTKAQLLSKRQTYVNIVSDGTNYPFCSLKLINQDLYTESGINASQPIEYRIYCSDDDYTSVQTQRYQWDLPAQLQLGSHYLVASNQRYLQLLPYQLAGVTISYIQVNVSQPAPQPELQYNYKSFLPSYPQTEGQIVNYNDTLTLTAVLNGPTVAAYTTLLLLSVPKSIRHSQLPYLFFQVRYQQQQGQAFQTLIPKTVSRQLVFALPSNGVSGLWLDIVDSYDHVVTRNLTQQLLDLGSIVQIGQQAANFDASISSLLSYAAANFSQTSEDIIQLVGCYQNILLLIQQQVQTSSSVKQSCLNSIFSTIKNSLKLSQIQSLIISTEARAVTFQKVVAILSQLASIRPSTIKDNSTGYFTIIESCYQQEYIFRYGQNVTQFSTDLISLIDTVSLNSPLPISSMSVQIAFMASQYVTVSLFPGQVGSQSNLLYNLAATKVDMAEFNATSMQSISLHTSNSTSVTDLRLKITLPVNQAKLLRQDQIAAATLLWPSPNIIDYPSRHIAMVSLSNQYQIFDVDFALTTSPLLLEFYIQPKSNYLCAYYNQTQQLWLISGVSTTFTTSSLICSAPRLEWLAIITSEFYWSQWEVQQKPYIYQEKVYITLVAGTGLAYLISFVMAIFFDKQKAAVTNRIIDEGSIVSQHDSLQEVFDKRQRALRSSFFSLLILTINYLNPLTNFIFAPSDGYSRKVRHLVLWTYILIDATICGALRQSQLLGSDLSFYPQVVAITLVTSTFILIGSGVGNYIIIRSVKLRRSQYLLNLYTKKEQEDLTAQQLPEEQLERSFELTEADEKDIGPTIIYSSDKAGQNKVCIAPQVRIQQANHTLSQTKYSAPSDPFIDNPACSKMTYGQQLGADPDQTKISERQYKTGKKDSDLNLTQDEDDNERSDNKHRTVDKLRQSSLNFYNPNFIENGTKLNKSIPKSSFHYTNRSKVFNPKDNINNNRQHEDTTSEDKKITQVAVLHEKEVYQDFEALKDPFQKDQYIVMANLPKLRLDRCFGWLILAKKYILILLLLLVQLALLATLYFILTNFDKRGYWSWVVATICSLLMSIFVIDLFIQILLTVIIRWLIKIKYDQRLAKMKPAPQVLQNSDNVRNSSSSSQCDNEQQNNIENGLSRDDLHKTMDNDIIKTSQIIFTNREYSYRTRCLKQVLKILVIISFGWLRFQMLIKELDQFKVLTLEDFN